MNSDLLDALHWLDVQIDQAERQVELLAVGPLAFAPPALEQTAVLRQRRLELTRLLNCWRQHDERKHEAEKHTPDD
ncbi:MAG: hypothetical protein MUD01_13860 [Chloroflexaceae bacterium]|jgi:hypothetical protein|nr:hypothetical protein [Chloroflexaceae bacterium]